MRDDQTRRLKLGSDLQATFEVEREAAGRGQLTGSAIPRLCWVVLSGAPEAQAEAMKVLTRFASPQALKRLERLPELDLPHGMGKQIRVLAAYGSEAAKELVQGLALQDRANWIAATALEQMGAEAVPALCDGLGSRYSHKAAASARLLGQIGNALAVEPLSRATLRTEPEVRREAMLALGKLGCDTACEALRQALARPDTGPLAALALVELEYPDEDLVPPLILALRDHDTRVRVRAARALERLAEGEAPLSLRGALGPLRRLSRSWLIDGDERALCRQVAERIRAATVGRADLPLPGRTRDTEALPVPAEAKAPPAESLPRPGREYEPEPPRA